MSRRSNSSQQPTTRRSLARRFRASFPRDAARALPGVKARGRLSERTLGDHVIGLASGLRFADTISS
jgi:hypothetical protein